MNKNIYRFQEKDTKILCTIGPACDSVEMIMELIRNGMDLARLNFSHGDHEYHLENIRKIREASKGLNYHIPIIADLQGPKIRIGNFENESIQIAKDQEFILTSKNLIGNDKIASTSYKWLPNDVKIGDQLLLDDGLLEFEIIDIKNNTDIICKVVIGGTLSNHKGINLPNSNLSLSSITEKDSRDIKFGLENEVDYFALSFVRRAEDVKELRQIITRFGACTPVIAKIEKQEAVNNIEDIIKVSQGIMVARGDLGIECKTEQVPIFQKRIIRLCNEYGKPVITATQMLDSMIRNPRPTRAEVTDVANAILDGTDAIMLSGETASGNYPVEAVNMMTKIAKEVEPIFERPNVNIEKSMHPVAEATIQAVVRAAESLKAKYIVCYTTGGSTARLLSKYRAKVPTLAFTHKEPITRLLHLHKGIYCIQTKESQSLDDMIKLAEEELIQRELVKKGDHIVITAGYPLHTAGTTNIMRILDIN